MTAATAYSVTQISGSGSFKFRYAAKAKSADAVSWVRLCNTAKNIVPEFLLTTKFMQARENYGTVLLSNQTHLLQSTTTPKSKDSVKYTSSYFR